MGLSMSELRNLTPHDVLRRFQPTTCAACGVTLHENTTGTRHTAAGCVCSDCFFEALGREIDQHPIGAPRRRTGSITG